MSYELWDTETRNLVETFESEADALQAVRELIALNTAVYPDALALVFEDDQDETRMIARDRGLAARASQRLAPPEF